MSDEALDAIDVLTRSGTARDRYCAVVGEGGDDAALIRAVIAANGVGGTERAPVDALVDIAASVRALQACVDGSITRAELAAGLATIGATSADFARCGPSRTLLQTALRIASDDALDARRVVRQLGRILGLVRDGLLVQLAGTSDASEIAGKRPPASTDAWREAFRVTDAAEVGVLDALATEWLEGPANYAGGGPGAAAFVRGWCIAPRRGDMIGEHDGDDAQRLARAAEIAASDAIDLIKIIPPSRYELHGMQLTIGSGARRSYRFPPGVDSAARAIGGDRGRSIITTPACAFVVLEQTDHHLVAGPRQLVEAICGCDLAAAAASFREYIDELTVDGEEPADLVAVEHRARRLTDRTIRGRARGG